MTVRGCVRCKHAAYCSRHGRIRLIERDALHPTMWINAHIHSGYRPLELPWTLCLRSIFTWNNETLNVWSHLVGFFYVGLMQYWCAFDALPRVNAPFFDYAVMAGSMTCSQICLALSAAYHTFGCHSSERRLRWLKADLFGVSLALLGIYLSGIYTSFYKFQEVQRLYTGCLTVILVIALSIPFFSTVDSDDGGARVTGESGSSEKVFKRVQRRKIASERIKQNKTENTITTTVIRMKCVSTVMQSVVKNDDDNTIKHYYHHHHHHNTRRIGLTHCIYIALALFGLYPTWHWIELHGGLTSPHVVQWLPTLVTLFVLLGLAFIFYATLIPERFFPGRFDMVGCSHQWWHLLILAAMVYWHNAGVQLLTHYHSQLVHDVQDVLQMVNTDRGVYASGGSYSVHNSTI